MPCDDRIVDRDNHLDAGGLRTVDDVFRREQVGGGDDDGADFVEGDHADPYFDALLEDEHDGVAFADALRFEEIGRLVGHALQVAEGEDFDIVRFVVRPGEGGLVVLFGRPCVDAVVAEIEAFWDDDLVVLLEIFV